MSLDWLKGSKGAWWCGVSGYQDYRVGSCGAVELWSCGAGLELTIVSIEGELGGRRLQLVEDYKWK